MQKTIIFLLFLILILACKPEYTHNNTILTAENLLYTNPDSSYKLLKSIKSPGKLPEVDYAAWCLNYVHARYKLYIEVKSDTALLNNALKYFKKNGPDKYSGITYYLLGCYFELDGLKSKAMINFNKSVNLLKNTNENNILGLNYFHISHFYIPMEMFWEAKKQINNAISCFKKAKNDKYLYYSYRSKAQILNLQKEPMNLVINELDKSIQLSKKLKDTTYYNELLLYKARVLTDYNTEYSKNQFLIEFSKGSKLDKGIYIYLTYIYAKQKQTDSARYFYNYIERKDLNKLEKFQYEIASAYMFKYENNFRDAFAHIENAYNLREETFSKNNKTLLLNIDKQYDFSQKEQERAKLEIANQQKIILIISLFVIILIGIFVQLQIRNRHKLKQNNMALEQKLLQFEIESQKRQHTQSLALIQANINNKIENTVKYKKLNTGLTNKDKIDDFIADVAKQAVVSENELDFYMQEADNLFGNRISKLKLHFPQLTTSDLIVISLICLRVDFNNICILLNISLNTLYTRRKRIKAHMGFDKNIDLETWIEQNIIKPE